MECLLIVGTNKFIFEDTLALMSPETNEEELRSNLILNVVALFNDFVFMLCSNSTNTLENS